MVLVDKVLLKADVLLMGRVHLKGKKLVFNSLEMVRNFWFGFAPLIEIFGKEEGFKMERTVHGFQPTFFGSFFIIILQEPPILKLESLVKIATLSIEHCKNRGMIILHHW